jgi:hypothetical protein
MSDEGTPPPLGLVADLLAKMPAAAWGSRAMTARHLVLDG